jgi:hypothetical protein
MPTDIAGSSLLQTMGLSVLLCMKGLVLANHNQNLFKSMASLYTMILVIVEITPVLIGR